MVNVIRLCGLSESTEEVYLRAVGKLARHYNRRPDEITPDEVQRYLLYLIEERKVSHSTSNCTVAGLRLFYHKVLGKTDAQFWIPRRRAPRKLPEVLNIEELRSLFAAVTSPKHRALLMTTYAAGLRVSEVVNLQVVDIDSLRMVIHVRQGKGNKDRYTVLSHRLLDELREYWRYQRQPVWLFPGARPDRPMVRETAERVFTQAKAKAGITKQGGIHMLRHGFATHLLERGVDVRIIQGLLGHASLASTSRYLHLTANKVGEEHSLLDLIRLPDRAWGSQKKM
jgi:site-specific recombinase XerD